MNGFVPVMVAVLLAEFGPRTSLYADARRFDASLWIIAAGVAAAAIAGGLIAPSLTGWADAFLIAIALAFAALGQVQRMKPATGLMPTVVAFWRGGVPLIAFAFAARFGPSSVATGTLAGLVIAAILTRVANSNGVSVLPLRWTAAAILAIAALVVAVGAMRLA